MEIIRAYSARVEKRYLDTSDDRFCRLTMVRSVVDNIGRVGNQVHVTPRQEILEMMKKRRRAGAKSVRLPRALRPFFWDYDFARLSWAADRDLIIARILAVGNWDSLRWQRRRFPDAELREWLVQQRGAG